MYLSLVAGAFSAYRESIQGSAVDVLVASIVVVVVDPFSAPAAITVSFAYTRLSISPIFLKESTKKDLYIEACSVECVTNLTPYVHPNRRCQEVIYRGCFCYIYSLSIDHFLAVTSILKRICDVLPCMFNQIHKLYDVLPAFSVNNTA
jgi:hypothetical protein